MPALPLDSNSLLLAAAGDSGVRPAGNAGCDFYDLAAAGFTGGGMRVAPRDVAVLYGT